MINCLIHTLCDRKDKWFFFIFYFVLQGATNSLTNSGYTALLLAGDLKRPPNKLKEDINVPIKSLFF